MSIGGFLPVMPSLSARGIQGAGHADRGRSPDDLAQELKAIFPHGVMDLMGRNFMKAAIGGASDPAPDKGITGGLTDRMIDRPKEMPPMPDLGAGNRAGTQDGRQQDSSSGRGQEGAADRSPSRHELLAFRRERDAPLGAPAPNEPRAGDAWPAQPPGTGGAFRGALFPRPQGAMSATARTAARNARPQSEPGRARGLGSQPGADWSTGATTGQGKSADGGHHAVHPRRIEAIVRDEQRQDPRQTLRGPPARDAAMP